MMESLDLSQSHHAKMKFKPIATQAQKKRPEKKTYQVSTKAADWSSLSVAEDEFQGIFCFMNFMYVPVVNMFEIS